MNTSLKALISGRSVTLIKQLASSGEGTVWTTNFPGFLAKLYHQPTHARIEKLKVMIAHPPQNPMRHHHHVTFAWPQDLLANLQDDCLGFLMPEILDGVKLSLIYNPKLRSRKAPRFNWYYLHTAALNFALALHSLHEEGYVVGDVKPQNLLVNNRALISVIDTDSFQVRDPLTQTLYRCLVGSEGFTPVELLGKELSAVDQTELQDRFRLGVMIYLLLFGDQPFKGKWIGRGESPQPSELIRTGCWPYAPNSMVQPGPNTIPLSIIHPQLQVCFQRCFTAGHRNPQDRPSAADWGNALKLAITDLRMCHLENNHYYSRVYGRCYWCDRRVAVGVDIFSPVQSIHQPSPPFSKTTPAVKTKLPNPANLTPLQNILLTQATITLLRSNSRKNRPGAWLGRWHNPALWGAGFITLGLAGLSLLLLPELNTDAIAKAGGLLESTLQRWIQPFSPGAIQSKPKFNLHSAGADPTKQTSLVHGGHWDAVTALDISLNDQLLISGSKDMTVKLWTLPTGKLQHTFSNNYEPIVSVGLNHNGQNLITSSLSGKILVWDLKTSELKSSLLAEAGWSSDGTIRTSAIDANGQLVASSGWGGVILLQYLQSGKVIKIPSSSLASEQALAVLPNGETVVTSSSDGKFQLWDTSTGSLLSTFPPSPHGEVFEPVNALTLSRDGQLLVSGGWYGSISLWDVASETLVKSFPKQSKSISVIALSDRKDQLATVSNDAVIQLWDVKTGKRTGVLKGRSEIILALKFTHDGKFLISGSDEPSIKIWRLSDLGLFKKLVQ